ncbi:MAG: YhdP family protein [Alcanivoracaceae bacterium]
MLSFSWRRRLADWMRGKLWWFAAGAVLLLAIWVVLVRQLLSMTPAWRADLEALIEARIQTPLEIGALSGHLSGLSPVFVLEDVRLPGADPAQPGLRLDRIELTVDVLPSLLNRTLRARSLVVRGLDIQLEIDEHGQLRLSGIEALGSASTSPESPHKQLLTILYRQKRIQVEEVTGTLRMAGIPDLQISDLALTMVSSGEHHRLAVRVATAEAQTVLDVRLDLRGDAFERGDLNGRGYVRLELAGPEPWMLAHWPERVRPEHFHGQLEGWLTIRAGELEKSALRTRLNDVTLTGDPLEQDWSLQRLEADASLNRDGNGYRAEVVRLVLASGEEVWQPGAASLAWSAGPERHWGLALHEVDLAPFARLLAQTPWQADHDWVRLSDAMVGFQPEGVLRRLTLRGTDRQVKRVSARFDGVSLLSDGARPGVSGLTGWVSGSAEGGHGRIDSPTLSLLLPAQFDQPFSAAASGPFRWRHDGELLTVDTGWLQVKNDDARGQALATLSWRREQVPELTLMAALTDGRAAGAARYFPAKRLGAGVADWLSQAFVGGTVDLGQFLHQGPLVIDPARQQDRTLQMQYLSDNMTLRFLPDWPEVTNLSARVLIDGRHIIGRDVSGDLMGSRIEAASVDIPSRQDHEVPQLIISSTLAGPAQSIGQLLQGTPLAAQLPEELADWQVEAGQYQGHVLLYWPLEPEPQGATVRAIGRVDNVDIHSPARRLDVRSAGGEFAFDLNEGLQFPALSARVFDSPVKASVVTRAGEVRIDWTGDTSVTAVRDWLELDLLAPVSGDFSYRSSLSLPWRRSAPVTLQVESMLESVAIDLPEPFAKRAGRPAAFRLDLTAAERGPDIRLRYQDWLSARLLLADGGLSAGRIRFGGGQALLPSRPGLTLEGRLRSFALADWTARLSGGEEAGALALPALDLRVGQLDLFGFRVNDAMLTALADDNQWRLTLDASNLDATLKVPESFRLRGTQPMILVVDKAELQRIPGTGRGELSPLKVPVMDVRLNSLLLNGEDMGRWQFAVRPSGDGVAIEELDAFWRSARVKGRIDWRQQGDRESSHFIGSFDTVNLARTLRQWKLPVFVESDDARAVVDLTWRGAPTELDYLALQGQASVAIGPGRFPKTDSKASALRVLGVFNLTTVSRRLRLDFTDLYKKGLSFEEVSGDFSLDGPQVGTSNLQIKSPSAEFRLRGEMDMANQQLDHYMEVTLPVSSNLYVGCLAGPAACAGIFVVERLWGDRLEKMTSLGYQVSGSWDDPRVEEVQGMFDRRRGG